MPVRVWLDLPRDARWVPSVRDVAGALLQRAGAPEADVADVQLALTEACANVVRHAVGTDSYTVALVIDPAGCEVEIVDHGPGFDEVAAAGSADEAETGRGLGLMRALVDDLEVRADTATTRVVLRKRSSTGLDPALVDTDDIDALSVGVDGLAADDQAHQPADGGRADVAQRLRRCRPFRPGESDPAWIAPHESVGEDPARIPSDRVGAGSPGDVRHRQPGAVEPPPPA